MAERERERGGEKPLEPHEQWKEAFWNRRLNVDCYGGIRRFNHHSKLKRTMLFWI